MKSYAVGESETDQGYATYEDSDDSDEGFYIYLLMQIIAIDVSLFLTFRLHSRMARNFADAIVQIVVQSIVAISPKPQSSPQININDVESNNTADDDAATNVTSSEESDKYLTIVSRREYIAMYALLGIAFTVYDAIIFHNRTSIQTANWELFPIPWQIIISTVCSIICIIEYGTLYLICNKCNRREIKQGCLKHWEEWAAVPFITVLINYVIVHVFWILLLLVSFPVLVALKGIFLMLLSLPVIIVLQRIFSCFKICCRRHWHPVSVNDFNTYFQAAIFLYSSGFQC